MRYQVLLFVMSVLFTLNAAAQLETQNDSASGVTVAVTPGNLGTDAKTWDFHIVLDTHSQDLSDDLAKSAVLTDEKGNEFKALAWEGAAPGGHHRSGVIKFDGVSPRPQMLELRINRPGEAKARIFRWDLN